MLSLVPVFFVCYLRAAERRAYVLADNRLADKGGYDRPRLAAELNELAPLLEQSGLNIELTGWEPAEIDTLFADLVDDERDPADDIVSLGEAAVTRPGETWVLERHRLHCGDARDSASYASLLGRERAAMVFTDGPYNVAVSSIVGRGKTKHREFPSASGEMSEAQYTDFLTNVHTHIARNCADGAIVFTCIDWRHIGQMLTAGAAAFSELKNIVVWVKSTLDKARSIVRNTSSLRSSRTGPGAHATMSNSAVMVATGQMSGNSPALIRSAPAEWTSSPCTPP